MLPPAEKGNSLAVDTRVCGSATNPFQLLQGKFSGVRVGGSTSTGMFAIVRTPMTAVGSTEPLYLLNGMPVDATAINSLFPCDIENIEVFTRPMAMWGSRGTNGVIAFFTRLNGGPLNPASDKQLGLAKMKRMGYNSPRQFYAPRYDINPATPTPDHRTTLWWEPVIKTDEHGRAHIVFWNSDEKHTEVRIVLEGLSYDGRPVVGSSLYNVP